MRKNGTSPPDERMLARAVVAAHVVASVDGRSSMVEDAIAAGDTVRLKSGGPIMTISRVSGTGANCVWFDGNQPVQRVFPLILLMKVDGTKETR